MADARNARIRKTLPEGYQFPTPINCARQISEHRGAAVRFDLATWSAMEGITAADVGCGYPSDGPS